MSHDKFSPYGHYHILKHTLSHTFRLDNSGSMKYIPKKPEIFMQRNLYGMHPKTSIQDQTLTHTYMKLLPWPTVVLQLMVKTSQF